MDIYAKSIRYLKRKIRKEDLTKEEWDKYAHENYLFSALTLIDKKKVNNFEELKQKVKKEKDDNFLYNQDIYTQIRTYQTKLNRIVEKKGVSDAEARALSLKIDKCINEFYDSLEEREYPLGNKMYEQYITSYYMIKEITLNDKFPDVVEWNKIAKRFRLTKLRKHKIYITPRLENA